MSLLSRFLGLKDTSDREEPASMRTIAARLDGLPPERARFLSAFAYVLARVAQADMHVDPLEVTAMEGSVAALSGLSDEEAALVTELAIAQAGALGETDDYLVTREFRKLSQRGDRLRLMRCLYAVAAADDSIGSAESREIRVIGEQLGFMRSEVNGLRLEWRDKLAELRKLPLNQPQSGGSTMAQRKKQARKKKVQKKQVRKKQAQKKKAGKKQARKKKAGKKTRRRPGAKASKKARSKPASKQRSSARPGRSKVASAQSRARKSSSRSKPAVPAPGSGIVYRDPMHEARAWRLSHLS